MPNISEDFWTDEEQAQQRLVGSLVLYDNAPAFVESVGDRMVRFYHFANKDTWTQAPLDDEKWAKYRNVPACGWYNYDYRNRVRAVYISRSAVRTRTHGLSRLNSKFYDLHEDGLRESDTVSFQRIAFSSVAAHCFKEGYPTYQGLLGAGAFERGRSFAMSRNFALYCRWDNSSILFHKKREVGLIVANTTFLFEKHAYLREELLEHTDLPREIKEA